MMKGRDMIDHRYLKHGRACVSLVLLLALLPLQLSAAPVRVIETEESFRVVDEGGGNPRKMRLRQQPRLRTRRTFSVTGLIIVYVPPCYGESSLPGHR